jgi:hypothetical protein
MWMDIMLIAGGGLRIKGKNSTLVVDPVSSTGKTEADAILALNNSVSFSEAKIEGSRITLKGPGEYEVGGAKVTTISIGEKLVARIDIDSVKVTVGSGEAVEKIQDKLEGSDILVVNADGKFNYSSLASLEPKVLIVYGGMKEEVSKSLGKESLEKLNKFATTVDKLPAELQYVILG